MDIQVNSGAAAGGLCRRAAGTQYRDAVMALNPTSYFQMEETGTDAEYLDALVDTTGNNVGAATWGIAGALGPASLPESGSTADSDAEGLPGGDADISTSIQAWACHERASGAAGAVEQGLLLHSYFFDGEVTHSGQQAE